VNVLCRRESRTSPEGEISSTVVKTTASSQIPKKDGEGNDPIRERNWGTNERRGQTDNYGFTRVRRET